mmetsp:Transcript_8494/g.25159  ORF Transcript_8494/g.25159 Transcript_8494/m.25159 type:complete len:217 (+) Transcript_8494:2812-3462(+)
MPSRCRPLGIPRWCPSLFLGSWSISIVNDRAVGSANCASKPPLPPPSPLSFSSRLVISACARSDSEPCFTAMYVRAPKKNNVKTIDDEVMVLSSALYCDPVLLTLSQTGMFSTRAKLTAPRTPASNRMSWVLRSRNFRSFIEESSSSSSSARLMVRRGLMALKQRPIRCSKSKKTATFTNKLRPTTIKKRLVTQLAMAVKLSRKFHSLSLNKKSPR